MRNGFIENDIKYILSGDYYLPNITVPKEEADITLGRFGMAHKDYLKKYKPIIFNQLMISGTLFRHCKYVENRAKDMIDALMQQLANTHGVTEQLKINDQMAWVGGMNNIKHCATEFVFREVIYNV